MKRELRVRLCAGAVALMAIAPPVWAQSDCGPATAAQSGETLEDVAERCGVSVEALRDANPDLSGELGDGTAVAMPSETDDLLRRAGDILRDAGREIEGAAREAGQSVADYLSSNPDVGRDIQEFGERYGVPGFQTQGQEIGANITIEPGELVAGETVTVRARGLRENVEAEVGLGSGGSDYEVVAQTRTDSWGRIETEVTLPDWISASENIVIVIETQNVRLTSDPVEVAGRT